MTDVVQTPTEPVAAATILLLRDGAEGIEIFMQERFTSTDKHDRFGGALLFPGGKVDKQDNDPVLRAYCRVADDIDDRQFALQVAAIREAFEECGVLLARPRGATALIDAARLQTLQNWRDRLNANETKLAEFLRAENLELACDQLVFFARWITPPLRMKRFDTHFYLAPAPQDHQLRHDGYESVDSLWIAADAALQGGREGRYHLLFPTRSNLEKLALSNTVRQACETAAVTPVFTVQPHIEKRADGNYVTIPREAGYPNCEDRAD